MVEFRLFRFLIEKNLYSSDLSRRDILSLVIQSRPKSRFTSNRVDAEWVITNIDTIDNESIKFFFGKNHEIQISQMNQSGDIVSRFEDDVPHSIIYLDLETGLGAIQLNSAVASTALAVSKKLNILLHNSELARQEYNVRIMIRPVRIGIDFVEKMSKAYLLTMIEAEYRKPNPPDSFRMVQQPVQNYLQELDGDTAKLKYQGDNLRREPAVEMAATAMRTGSFVRASIKEFSDTPTRIIRSTEEDIASFYIEEEVLLGENGDRTALERMRRALDESSSVLRIQSENRNYNDIETQ
ncbi:hypothetical protein [uncultured Deinococcus sp.]|uniref:hypothetical protein n=1 Tax=uncultured Deinococcus sp. TaxID=158789 RepID=UPI0025D04BEF|nr:hypothetical protein [uncultured Deinococcus sp.]